MLGDRAPALQVSFDVVLPPDQYQPFRASSFRRTWLSVSYEFFVCWKRQMISVAEKSNSDFWLLLWIFLSCDVRSQNTSFVHYFYKRGIHKLGVGSSHILSKSKWGQSSGLGLSSTLLILRIRQIETTLNTFFFQFILFLVKK